MEVDGERQAGAKDTGSDPEEETPMDMDLEPTSELPHSTTPTASPTVLSTTPPVSPPSVPILLPGALVAGPSSSAVSSSAPPLPSQPTAIPVCQPPPGMVTPKARILRHIGIKYPTPARDILRANAVTDAAVANVVPRPPTPPKITDRTPENGYPPLSTASTPATPEHSSFADRISTAGLKANHVIRSPNSRPPVLSIITQFTDSQTGAGPRHSRPGDDDPFFIRKPPPMPSPSSRPPMPPPPMICVFDPDDVVVDQVGVPDGMEVDDKEVVPEECSVKPAAAAGVAMVDTEKDGMACGAQQESQPQIVIPTVESTARPMLSRTAPGESLGESIPSQPESMEADSLAPLSPKDQLSDNATTDTAAADASSTPTSPTSTPTGPPGRQFSGGLPPRRPTSRPAELGLVGPSRPHAANSLRKASYPASLGSGPLRHQNTRVVSNPVPPPSMTNDKDPEEPTSPRSVSEPTRGATANVRTPPPPRMSMSMSSRHQDTSRNLAGLSDVLARLRAPNEPRNAFTRRTPSSAPAVLQDDGTERVNARKYSSAPSRLSKSTSSRPKLTTLGERSANTGSLSSMMSAASGTFLKGVVAYVDVYTTEGDEAGGTFVEMLKRCGAKVLVKKPTEACTHIIYKTGRPATANFVRRLDAANRPKVVGIKWVTRCAELRTWVSEEDFAVNLDSEDVFTAKKKSMQPKAVRGGLGGLGGGAGGLGIKTSTLVRPVPRTNAYAPKVGSPLKKSYVHQDENENQ